MTKYNIKVYSKNKKSLNHFFKFVLQFKKKIKNPQRTFKLARKKNKIKRVTVLKSPHVNKKAQSQFQLLIHIINIQLFSWNEKKLIIFFKKIKNSLFPGMQIKIEKMLKNSKLTNFTKFKSRKNILFSKKKLLKKTLLNIKTLDNYGHLI